MQSRLYQAKRVLGNQPGVVKVTRLSQGRTAYGECASQPSHKHTPAASVDSLRAQTRSVAAAAAAASAPAAAMEPLVTADWLAERLTNPSVRVLDAAWYMPVHNRNNHADHRAVRIPGARFFDIDGIAADPATARGLPHMLPSEQGFAAAMDALGITNDTTVVLYDHLGIFSAPRAWWTFKVFGHDKVAVLQGGLPAWRAKGLPLETDNPPPDEVMFVAARACASPPAATRYRAVLDKSKVRSLDDMLANIRSRGEQVMDARSGGRFVGTEPEPRPGLRGGHIPGARSLPFPTLLEGGAYKPREALQAAFRSAGLDPEQPLVGSCGSGLTACILALGLFTINGKLAPVYDGSWMEYGARDDLPISTLPEDP
ncbi:hypothetical protein PLESTB_001076300 [Pleodorina starrii]|uniref:Sulfurtransferase n=1 Tax=Pleodorina starrii TaxID=330485 RepID=A0A9W6F4G3_9CHLO|nr:hypothetical protein PLESTM_001182800 [Pleodorina starrii]GLC56173.1 hypothetical protein PLESTB_001076300 [Pleodorina starrii]GLC74941.1 hypothetical protein PLESTF_001575400 [Pleodorina starrii]